MTSGLLTFDFGVVQIQPLGEATFDLYFMEGGQMMERAMDPDQIFYLEPISASIVLHV